MFDMRFISNIIKNKIKCNEIDISSLYIIGIVVITIMIFFIFEHMVKKIKLLTN